MSEIRLVGVSIGSIADSAADTAPASTENPELARIAARLTANAEQQGSHSCGNKIVAWQGLDRKSRLANIAERQAAKREGREPRPIVTTFPGYSVE